MLFAVTWTFIVVHCFGGVSGLAMEEYVECSSNQCYVELFTDDYSDETSLSIVGISNNTDFQVYAMYTDFSDSTRYYSNCLDYGQYIVTIYDNYADGICCDYGSGKMWIRYLNSDTDDYKFNGKFGSRVSFAISNDNDVDRYSTWLDCGGASSQWDDFVNENCGGVVKFDDYILNDESCYVGNASYLNSISYNKFDYLSLCGQWVSLFDTESLNCVDFDRNISYACESTIRVDNNFLFGWKTTTKQLVTNIALYPNSDDWFDLDTTLRNDTTAVDCASIIDDLDFKIYICGESSAVSIQLLYPTIIGITSLLYTVVVTIL